MPCAYSHRPKIIAGVAGFLFGKVAIIEVEVAHQRRVVKSSAVGRVFPIANQRRQGFATEILKLLPYQRDGWPLKRTKSAAEGVEHVNLELLACFLGKVFIPHAFYEGGKLFNLCHIFLFSAPCESSSQDKDHIHSIGKKT